MIELPAEYVYKLVSNGFYIPFFYAFMYAATGNFFLSTIVALKLFPANYYYWFEHHYSYMPSPYNALKQFVRFTDTGHIVSFLYYFDRRWLPIAFNTHFVITVGYWAGKALFAVRDPDDIARADIVPWFSRGWSYLNHSVPLALFVYEIVGSGDRCIGLFTWDSLYASYVWFYAWAICIYFPWRLVTGDIVYSILSIDTPLTAICAFGSMIHLLYLAAHGLGFILTWL